MLNQLQKAYLAGFLDGDGSIYVQLKPNSTYRYGFQVAPYIVLFQSQKDQKKFEKVWSVIGMGHLRIRKDGILEYLISKTDELQKFLAFVEPFLVMKKEQAHLMLNILEKKKEVRNEKDFEKLAQMIDIFRNLNYSKKRKKHILAP